MPFRVFLFFIASAALLFSCSKRSGFSKKESGSENREKKSKIHELAEKEKNAFSWYLFKKNSLGSGAVIEKITSPFDLQTENYEPWTEAVRISGLGAMYNPPSVLINKLGILHEFSADSEPVITVHHPFTEKTASGFYKTDTGNLIRFYNNSVFSNRTDFTNEASLYRYDLVTEKLTPIIAPSDFGLKKNAQLTSLEYNKKWYASFKTAMKEKVQFDYFSFLNISDVLKGNYKKIKRNEFIAGTEPLTVNILKTEKTSLKAITKMLTEKIDSNIEAEFFSEESENRTLLIRQTKTGTADLTACALSFTVSNPTSNAYQKQLLIQAILLSSGTLIINKNNESNIVQLPDLPEHFVYTYFSINGSTVLAGWENQRFFEVGSAGFLLYKLPF